MLRKLRPRSIYDVMAAIGCFAALATGSAYAANEWNSSNIQNETLLSEDVKNGTLKAEDYGIGSVSGARIQDNNVTSLDLADGAVFGNDIRDGSLNDEDVGQISLVNFFVNIGTVAARSCDDHPVAVTDSAGDHFVLTPYYPDTASDLDYSVQQNVTDSVEIHVCNPTNADIVQDAVRFNLVVIDGH